MGGNFLELSKDLRQVVYLELVMQYPEGRCKENKRKTLKAYDL